MLGGIEYRTIAAAVRRALSAASYLAAGAGAIYRSWTGKLGEVVSVLDFIPVNLHAGIFDGTNTANLEVYVQAAFDSLLTRGGGKIIFPRGTYLIGDTVHVGRFSVAANNNVLGFAFTLANLDIDLCGSTVRWNGADQPGTTKVVKADTVGNYNLITDDKPMFSIVACQDFKIGKGYLRGDSAAGNRAFSGLWFQGNHNNHSFDTLVAVGMRIPVRHGCAWDHALGVQYWGYADSPYYKANVYNAPAVGGWQGDTQDFHACNFAGTMAHYSTESAQNLSIVFNAWILGEGVAGTPYGIVMVGGRISGKGLGIVVAATYDVYMPSGTNEFSADQYHSESAAAYKIRTSTNAASPSISLSLCDAPKVDIAGGGAKLNIVNSGNVLIKRRDVNARCDINLKNCSVDTIDIDATTVKGNIFTSLENCKGVGAGAIFTGVGASDQYLRIVNTTPASKLPDTAALQYSLVNGENVYGTVVRWAQEALEGFTHRFWHAKNIPHNVATVVGSIATVGNNYVGDADIIVTWSGGASANQAALQEHYSLSWTRDSGGNVTVGAVAVFGQSTALDGFASMANTVTAAYNGGTGNIDISLTQTNGFAVAMNAFISGACSLKGGLVFATSAVWTPG